MNQHACKTAGDKNTLNNGRVAVTGVFQCIGIYLCSDWFETFQNVDMLSPVHANQHISHNPRVKRN